MAEQETMTQLETMDFIITNLDRALACIGASNRKYKTFLSQRRFSKKEIDLLDRAYAKTLTVWCNMRKRRERERKMENQ